MICFRVSTVFVLLSLPVFLKAQSFPSFEQVAYVTVQDFSTFEAIWEKAQTENVRLALFGDSQETAPGGAGRIFVPRLNYEFYKQFGKVGESFAATGSGSYQGDWLLNGSFGSGVGNTSGTLPLNQRLPGISTRIYTSSALGMNTHLDTSNSVTSAASQIPSNHIWGPNDDIHAVLFGLTKEGSSEFSWRALPTNGGLNFFQPITTSGTTTMGLDAPAGEILSEQVGPLNSDGFSNRQVIVRGSDQNGAELVATRYLNLSTPGGVSVQDFAAGGYRTDSFLNQHSQAGKMLTALGPWDAVLIHTGANDAYSGFGKSAIAYQNDVSALINLIRGPSWLDNPNQKFILFTDQYRDQGPTAQNDEFDQYAGALADLALNDANIMAVNSRRLTNMLGWNQDSPTTFLSDVVHYNSNGAIVLASVEAQLMLNGGIVGDFDIDGDVDIDDIDFYAGKIGSTASGELTLLDLDGDGQITQNDRRIHIETYAFTSNGQTGTFIGDLNLDGNVDVINDAFTLISNLGSSVDSYSDGDTDLDGTVSVIEDAFSLISNLGNSNNP